MSNEDLSQRRNETNFHYASRIKQYNLEKEQEKHNRTMQMQYEKVMNNTTDRTSLHHSDKSIFKDADVQSAREVLEKTSLIHSIKERMNRTLPVLDIKRLRTLDSDLMQVELNNR